LGEKTVRGIISKKLIIPPAGMTKTIQIYHSLPVMPFTLPGTIPVSVVTGPLQNGVYREPSRHAMPS